VIVLAPFERFVGIRYSFTRQRNRFTAVVALVSLLGMALGVASLITVLSVMNGFAAELQLRILSLVPHGFVRAERGNLADWQPLAAALQAEPTVSGLAPFIESKALVRSYGGVRGVSLTAIDPTREVTVSRIATAIVAGKLESLEQRPFGIVIGTLLAQSLNVSLGDTIELTLPRLTVTPLGTFPRVRRFEVVAIFEVGAQADLEAAFVSLADGQRLFSKGEAIDGLRLALVDQYAAPRLMADLATRLPHGLRVQDWSTTQGSLFRAVKMEKVMVSVLLLSVVAVAAFNIVSTLSMSVAEKRGDIAVLRTLGATAGSVRRIFIAHGLSLALAGIVVGVVGGCLLSLYIGAAVGMLESLFGAQLFDPSVYFISNLPAILRWQDVVGVTAAALCLSVLATLYPASRAAAVAPAEVLRYVQ